jgi:hypothetical protein
MLWICILDSFKECQPNLALSTSDLRVSDFATDVLSDRSRKTTVPMRVAGWSCCFLCAEFSPHVERHF